MANSNPSIDLTSALHSLSIYPFPRKGITPQKIIGIISLIVISVFFSIASFYSAQLSFAIINTCFFTLLGGSIVYSLIIPPVTILPSNPTPVKPRQPKRRHTWNPRVRDLQRDGSPDGVVFSIPREVGRDGRPFPRPRGPDGVIIPRPRGVELDGIVVAKPGEVFSHSPLTKNTKKKPCIIASLRRRTTYHPPSPSLI